MNSNIRNEGHFTASFWDWTPFNSLFKYGIRISDIDGVVERNGHVLYIETKLPGANVPTGQERLHDAWVEKGDTVLLVWGKPNRPQSALLRHGATAREIKPCSTDDLNDIVRRWFSWADSNGLGAPQGGHISEAIT